MKRSTCDAHDEAPTKANHQLEHGCPTTVHAVRNQTDYNGSAVEPGFKHEEGSSLIRTLCGEPSPLVWRAIGSLLLGAPTALLTMGFADQESLPMIGWLLSPGGELGIIVQRHATGSFINNFMSFVWTALSANLIYWSSIYFWLFSLRARSRKSN